VVRLRGRSLAILWLVIAAVASIAWAYQLVHNVPRGDDLTYLDWTRAHGTRLADVVTSPPPYPGVRPMNALVWWLVGRDASGRASAIAEGALWFLALVSWAGWARARAGWSAAAWTTAFLLATPWFRDLPTWRSWMTTTGSCAFLGAALWSFECRRPALALALGTVALGFKENSGIVLAVAAALVYRRWVVSALLCAALAPGVLDFSGGRDVFVPADPVAHAVAYVRAVGTAVWPSVMALAAVHPLASPLALLGHWFPLAAGAIGVGAAAASGIETRSPWALVIAAGCVLPLCYATHNPVYLLETALVSIVLFAAALAARSIPWWVGLLGLAPTLWTVAASRENAIWQRSQWDVARAVIAGQASGAPGILHLAPDAHDAGRFAAYWLQRERGWTESDVEQPVELCPGLTAQSAAPPP
jgi:hypothetical protein